MDLARKVEGKIFIEQGEQSLKGGRSDKQWPVGYNMRQLLEPYAPKVDGLSGNHGPSRWAKPDTY